MFKPIKIILFSLSLYSIGLRAQTKEVCFGHPKSTRKCYKCYLSLSDANKVPIDSVEGLVLISNGFSDFPKEVLKFKNLKYLEIGSYMWFEVLDSLTPQQRKEHDSLKARLPDVLEVNKYYKTNYIKHVPKQIANLKKLEFVNLGSAYIENKRKFKKIFEYLPGVEIFPDKQFLDQP